MESSIKKPSFTETFPKVAAVIGDFRKEFGDVIRIYACENGIEVGKPLDESRFTVIEGRDICTNSMSVGVKRGK